MVAARRARRGDERDVVGDGGDLPDAAHPSGGARAGGRDDASLMPGRFRFGVGSGEALNEHIFGDAWPRPEIRLEMLEEAVEVIRSCGPAT